MSKSWKEIHNLEISGKYPDAIDALEERHSEEPADCETVIRLGFDLWYAVVENERLGMNLPVESYAQRFMNLFTEYEPTLNCNADFCFAFGLGISMFWFKFSGADQALGEGLLQRACDLDEFWGRHQSLEVAQEEMSERFDGRGIFARYYDTT